MKPEMINGKKYQPVRWVDDGCCDKCAFGGGRYCNVYKCLAAKRRDNMDVYFIEIKEQEQ